MKDQVRRKRPSLSLLVALISGSFALAPAWGQQQYPGPTVRTREDLKPVKVNVQEVIVSTQEGKRILEDLRQRFAPQQAALKKLNAEIVDLKQQLDEQNGQLSEKERKERKELLSSKEKELRTGYDAAQKEYQAAQAEIIRALGAKFLTVVSKYCRAQRYDVLIDVSNPEGGVLWASDETLQALGIFGKRRVDIDKRLAAAFAGKDGPIISKELIAAYDADNP